MGFGYAAVQRGWEMDWWGKRDWGGKLGETYEVLELFSSKMPIIPIVYPVSAACLVPGTVTH